MAGDLLLDTNIIIAALSQESTVVSALMEATDVFIPHVVLGELRFGALCSSRPEENLQRLQSAIVGWDVLGANGKTAEIYAALKVELRRKGRPIPDNDLWIAALSVQYNLALVTRDAHFGQLESLTLRRW